MNLFNSQSYNYAFITLCLARSLRRPEVTRWLRIGSRQFRSAASAVVVNPKASPKVRFNVVEQRVMLAPIVRSRVCYSTMHYEVQSIQSRSRHIENLLCLYSVWIRRDGPVPPAALYCWVVVYWHPVVFVAISRVIHIAGLVSLARVPAWRGSPLPPSSQAHHYKYYPDWLSCRCFSVLPSIKNKTRFNCRNC